VYTTTQPPNVICHIDRHYSLGESRVFRQTIYKNELVIDDLQRSLQLAYWKTLVE